MTSFTNLTDHLSNVTDQKKCIISQKKCMLKKMSQWLVILFGSLYNQFQSKSCDSGLVRKPRCYSSLHKQVMLPDYVRRSHQSDLSKKSKHWDIFLSHCSMFWCVRKGCNTQTCEKIDDMHDLSQLSLTCSCFFFFAWATCLSYSEAGCTASDGISIHCLMVFSCWLFIWTWRISGLTMWFWGLPCQIFTTTHVLW